MKSFVRISLLLLICLSIIPASAQKRGSKAKAKASPSSPRTFCQGDTIPNGFVVVGATRTSKCVELTVKKPAPTETVCDGSPVPEGYSVVKQSSSPSCYDASANPLTNAMVISNGEITVATPPKAGARRRNDDDEDDEPSIRITVGGNQQNEPQKSILEQRAAQIQRQAKLENQANSNLINLGMTQQQVFNSWGRSYRTSGKITGPDGKTVETWTYVRNGESVDIHFTNSIVDDWTWYH